MLSLRSRDEEIKKWDRKYCEMEVRVNEISMVAGRVGDYEAVNKRLTREIENLTAAYNDKIRNFELVIVNQNKGSEEQFQTIKRLEAQLANF